MASLQLLVALLFITTFSLHIGYCHILKGSVTCMDCDDHHSHLSGIKVSVTCSKLKRLATTITEEDGSFETSLPLDTTTTSPAPNICHANIIGGPNQFFVSRKDNMDTKVVNVQEDNDYSYTISKPLKFYTKCPTSMKDGKLCGGPKRSDLRSSKTINLPLPKEFGLAPSSYYFPVLPIIGIP